MLRLNSWLLLAGLVSQIFFIGCGLGGSKNKIKTISEQDIVSEYPQLKEVWQAFKDYDQAGDGNTDNIDQVISTLSDSDIENLLSIRSDDDKGIINILTSNTVTSNSAKTSTGLLTRVSKEAATHAVNHRVGSSKTANYSPAQKVTHMLATFYGLIINNAYAKAVSAAKAPLNDLIGSDRDISNDDHDARRNFLIALVEKDADAKVIDEEIEMVELLGEIATFAPQELNKVFKTANLTDTNVASAIKDFSCQFKNLDDVKKAFSSLSDERKNNTAFSDLAKTGACTIADISDNKIRALAKGLGEPDEIRNLQGFLRGKLNVAKQNKDQKAEETIESMLFFFNKGLFDRVIEELKSLGENPQHILTKTKYGEMMKDGSLDKMPWWLGAVEGLDFFFKINEKLVKDYKLSGVKELYKTADDKAMYMIARANDIINNHAKSISKNSHSEIMLKNAVTILVNKLDALKADSSLKPVIKTQITNKVPNLNLVLTARGLLP